MISHVMIRETSRDQTVVQNGCRETKKFGNR